MTRRTSVMRQGALTLLLAVCSGCETDDYVAPLCLYEPDEAVPVDEEWGGVVPLDAVNHLDGLVGDWAFSWSYEDDAVVVPLHAKAVIAGEPRLYRPYHYDEGSRERCDTERMTMLGVPLEIELTSPDEAWSLSGTQTAYAVTSDPDAIEWDFLEMGGELLRVDNSDQEILSALRSRACSDEVGVRLHRRLERRSDGTHWISLSFASWCDDSWFETLAAGWWYPGRYDSEREPE